MNDTYFVVDAIRLSVTWPRIGVFGVIATLFGVATALRALFSNSFVPRYDSHSLSIISIMHSPFMVNGRLFWRRNSSANVLMRFSIFGISMSVCLRSFSSLSSCPPRLLYRFGSFCFASNAFFFSHHWLREMNKSKMGLFWGFRREIQINKLNQVKWRAKTGSSLTYFHCRIECTPPAQVRATAANPHCMCRYGKIPNHGLVAICRFYPIVRPISCATFQ